MMMIFILESRHTGRILQGAAIHRPEEAFWKPLIQNGLYVGLYKIVYRES
jgi:hypothetical protein